jgi:hypothetical protein
MRRSTTFVASFAALILLVGCDRPGGAGETPRTDMELRVYPVPVDATDKLRAAIADSLRVGDKSTIGSVSSPAPGKLIVLAPGKLQESIAVVLEKLASADKAQTSAPAPQYRLRFWVVDAVFGDGADDPAIADIATATNEVRKQLGPAHFSLHATVSATSRAQYDVNKRWADAPAGSGDAALNQLHYKLFSLTDGLNLELGYTEHLPVASGKDRQYLTSDTTTTVPIRLGQLLVLSQNPVGAPGADAKPPVPAKTRLYIVRVDPVSGA